MKIKRGDGRSDPFADPASQGDPHEPALGGSRLRRRHARLPEGRRALHLQRILQFHSARRRPSRPGCRCSCSPILFGLSMDYHVFLLSRIREEYDKTARQHRVGRVRVADDGGHHHGRGDHHGRGLHRVRRARGVWARCSRWSASLSRSSWTPPSCGRCWFRRACGCWATGLYLPGWLQWLPQLHVEGREPEHETVTVPETSAELIEKS